MASTPHRRAHPAQRGRTTATLVAAGTTVALVVVMGATRHPPAAGGTVPVDTVIAGDDSQATQPAPDYRGAAPAYPAPAAHTRTHGS